MARRKGSTTWKKPALRAFLRGACSESFMLNGAEKLLFITVTWGRIKREINKSEPQKLATKKMEGNPYDKKDNWRLNQGFKSQQPLAWADEAWRDG